MLSVKDLQIASESALRALVARLSGTVDRDIRDAFFVAVESTLAQGATDTQRFTLDIDADYMITHAVGDVRDNAAGQTKITDPAIMVSLAQSQSGRQLQNIPIHWNNLIGTAQLPAEWPAPKHLNGGTTLSVTQTNNSGAATVLKSRITFWGYKIFPR